MARRAGGRRALVVACERRVVEEAVPEPGVEDTVEGGQVGDVLEESDAGVPVQSGRVGRRCLGDHAQQVGPLGRRRRQPGRTQPHEEPPQVVGGRPSRTRRHQAVIPGDLIRRRSVPVRGRVRHR